MSEKRWHMLLPAGSLRPASADQPLGPRWPAKRALFSTRGLTEPDEEIAGAQWPQLSLEKAPRGLLLEGRLQKRGIGDDACADVPTVTASHERPQAGEHAAAHRLVHVLQIDRSPGVPMALCRELGMPNPRLWGTSQCGHEASCQASCRARDQTCRWRASSGRYSGITSKYVNRVHHRYTTYELRHPDVGRAHGANRANSCWP